MLSFQAITRQLSNAKFKHPPSARSMKSAAVCLLLCRVEGEIQVLMIQRAIRKGDPWSGNMAFPGGLSGSGDISLLHTAKRELWEETGINVGNVGEAIGRLSERRTKAHNRWSSMVVVPYVFRVDHQDDLKLELTEAVDWVWIPLTYLCKQSNRKVMYLRLGRYTLRLPYYLYKDKRVWGLSLHMLDELLAVCERDHPVIKSRQRIRRKM